MPRADIPLAILLLILINGGAVVAQVPSVPCDQAAGSCSLNPQPARINALSPAIPESSPQVSATYDRQLLSVQAHGASLRSVLAVISQRTGTEIDFGGEPDAGGVYVNLGPASVHDLLRNLLNGSELNYVMLRSRSDPGFVEKLVILGREHGTGRADRVATSVVAIEQPSAPQLYGAGFAADPDEVGSPGVAAPAEQQSVQPALAAQPTAVQPSVEPSIQQYQQQYQQALADAASSGKSRAQILDELQKLQQKELDDQYSQSQPH